MNIFILCNKFTTLNRFIIFYLLIIILFFFFGKSLQQYTELVYTYDNITSLKSLQ